MILYHGTNTIVEHPEVRICGYNKDFGFGFYCTQFERQAKRWALTKRGKHIVCVYDYTPNHKLKEKIFPQMTDEWLDFVVMVNLTHLTLLKDLWQTMKCGTMLKISYLEEYHVRHSGHWLGSNDLHIKYSFVLIAHSKL